MKRRRVDMASTKTTRACRAGQTDKMTRSFSRAVQNAVRTSKQSGHPVARYDAQRRQAYLEYPGDRRVYVDGE